MKLSWNEFHIAYRRPVRVGALLLAGLLVTVACAPGVEYHRLTGRTMGTDYVVVLAGGGACNGTLAQPIEAELQRVDTQMSTWRPDSEISRFNAAAAGEWFGVSTEISQIVLLSQSLAETSAGAFDITVGPLVDLWGFGPSESGRVPAASEIEAAASTVGHNLLKARQDPPALRKREDGLRLDLSAIAKGHGVDRLAALLDDNACSDYLIEIGGEVRLRGANRGGGPWRIGIEAPFRVGDARKVGGEQLAGNTVRILRLTDIAVATSGDYRNLRRVDDGGFSHTIDPRTGHPVTHAMASVTVVAETAAMADGLATLINVLGPDDGLAYAEQEDIAALALVRTDAGVEQRYTAAMREFLD